MKKRYGIIKARAYANGSTQRTYINKLEAASPTVSTEGLITTAVIDANQNGNVITLVIPNTFVQTPIPEGDHKVIIRINDLLVHYLTELFPGKYKNYTTIKNNSKILYVEMRKALYRMILSSRLFYKHFRADLESTGLKINPYNLCVANHKRTSTNYNLAYWWCQS